MFKRVSFHIGWAEPAAGLSSRTKHDMYILWMKHFNQSHPSLSNLVLVVEFGLSGLRAQMGVMVGQSIVVRQMNAATVQTKNHPETVLRKEYQINYTNSFNTQNSTIDQYSKRGFFVLYCWFGLWTTAVLFFCSLKR